MMGLIISDIANPFFPDLVKGFEEAALRDACEVLVTNTGYSSSRMAICVRRMLERKVDGVAIMTSEMDPALVAELSRNDLPIVFLDTGAVKKHISNICVDYAHGIKQAVEHLLALGHRRIAFISGALDLKSARTRRTAFLRCLGRYQISKDRRLIVEGNHRIDGGQAAMRRLLELAQPPTAVLASNDLTAMGALGVIQHAGLQVPRDISVVGFDDIEFARFTQPPLTTIRLSRAELGHTAFDALMRVQQGERGRKYVVETRLIVRDSTGPGVALEAATGVPTKTTGS
jgi:DNA-binding LacI/PurR family transcriptional regulator